MITVKCQYTGIEFEAESSRTKNHPAVSAFLLEASKENGHYRGASHTAKTLIVEADGYDNIDEFMTAVRNAYDSWKTSGTAAKVVKTHAEKIAAGERRIAWATQNTSYEEATDGNAYSNPRQA